MATIKWQKVKTPFDGTVQLFKWANMADGDVGQAVAAAGFNDKTVRVAGDFGAGGQVVAEGSLIPETVLAADYDPLVDPQGNPIAFSVAGIETVLENVYLFRPRVAAGTGVDVTVYLLTR
jgi:hypothetical protein